MRWHIQMGFIVIPGSKNVNHIKDNIDIFDFELTSEEMNEISKLDTETRYYYQDDSDLERYASCKPTYESQ